MSKHTDRPSYLWLYIGVSSTAVALGYMVGASVSPVVASVIPAVFGLVLVAFGVLKDHGLRVGVEDKGTTAVEPEKANLASRAGIRPLGIMLTVFAISYLGAAILGTEIRARASVAEQQFPWTEKNRPTKRKTVLEWLVVQERLVAYGYTPDQVRQVYELYQSMPENPNLDLSESLLEHVPEPGALLKRQGVGAGLFGGGPQHKTQPDKVTPDKTMGE